MPLFRKAELLDNEKGIHVLPLLHLVIQSYGPESLDWDSPVLRAELEDDYGTVGDLTWERIQAGRVMTLHDAFWKEWEVFEKCCAAIVGEPPIFSFMQPPESEEIAIALATAAKIDRGRRYDDDVKAYIASACLFDGLWYLEAPLDIASDAMARHDKEKNIERNVGGVSERLKTASTMIKNPESAVDVQVNNVLSVRNVLADYWKEVDAQLEQVPSWVKRRSA